MASGNVNEEWVVAMILKPGTDPPLGKHSVNKINMTLPVPVASDASV